MGKTSYLLIGAVAGAAVAMVYHYFFGPAPKTTYDENYRSRLDYALDEGERAALAQQARLQRQFEEYKQRPAGEQRPASATGPVA
ncbi:MAG: hypothetical protein V9G19_11485 [Tetrasphaera sp.]